MLSAAALMFVLAACSTVAMTQRSQLNFVPGFLINDAATDQYYSYVRSRPVCRDAQTTQLVNQVADDLIQATTRYYTAQGDAKKLKGYKWKVSVVEDPTPNAFVVGPGKIVVNTGILRITQDEHGLATVMGHEIAHALAKHGNERVSQLLLAQAGAIGLSVALSKETPELQMAVQQAYGLGTTLAVILPFSRKHEKEADEIGLYLMAMAGYDPEEAPGFWERMERLAGGGMPAFLSTHPSHDTRHDNLQTLIPRAKEYARMYGN